MSTPSNAHGESQPSRWIAPSSQGAVARKLAPPAVDAPPIPENEIVGLVLTGYLDTEIRFRSAQVPASERYRWSLAPGIDRPRPLGQMSAVLAAAIDTLPPNARCRFSPGWVDADRRHHLAPGRTTVATALGLPDAWKDRRRIIAAAAGLGALLKQLRSVPLEGLDLSIPTGPTRLAEWLRTGEGPWAAALMHDRVTARLGRSRIDEILSWIDELPREQLVHGRSGLAATVLSDSDAPSALLIGDEIAVGPRDFDLSCVLGELLVAEHLLQHSGGRDVGRRRELISNTRDAVLVAYGPSKDLIASGRMTALRVLQELHDSAAFQDRQLTSLASAAADLVDDSR